MKIYKLNLHAFEGEGSGESNTGATSQVATENNGATEGTEPNQTDAQSESNNSISFDEFVKQHKDESNKWFQQRFNERHRDYKELQRRNNATAPLLDVLSARYGIDASNIDDLVKAVQDDDALYEDKAAEEGLTIEQYKHMQQMEAENKRLRDMQNQAYREQQMNKQLAEWDNQANNLRQIFPDFDLNTELQNEDFANALRSGLSMERAFYAVHGSDIISGAMQSTAQQVRQAVAEDIASKGNRPKENGLANNASAKVSKDMHNLTKQERAEMAKRSMFKPYRFS